MNTMTSNRLVLFTLAATVLGIIFGIFLPDLMLALAFVGDLFVNVLLVLFIPLVGSAIITGVSAFAGKRQVAKAALGTLALFLGTTVIAIVVGLILTVIIKPGVGVNTGAGFIPPEIIDGPVTQSLDFLGEILPSNIINALTHGKFLGWMIVLIVAAGVLGTIGQKAKALTDFFEAIYAVALKVLGVVINLVPVGLFFVIGTVIARNNGTLGSLFDGLSKFSLTLLIGFLVQAFLIIPIVIKFFAKRSPLEYFLNVFPAIKTALASGSTTAALPVTYENSIERNNIDNRVAALVLPVGSSLNVNGRALYVTVSALFIAQAFDVPLGFLGTLYVAVAAFFFSLGTGTVPFVGMLTLVSVFDFAGFPNSAYAGIGLIFVIDWFWARVFAALDVWSDTAVAAAVEESVVTDISRPERPPRDDFRSDRPYDRGRGRDRRDFPRHRGRDDSRRRDSRYDRERKPYIRHERESIRPESAPSRPDRHSERPESRDRGSRSPFELKPEREKAFNIETVKAEESKPTSPSEFKKTETPPDERSKLRERKSYAHGHDVAKKRGRPRSKPKSDEAPEESSGPSPRPAPIAPPPLIRDISPEKEKPQAAPPIEEKPQPAQPAPEEAQTSLFGRTPARKGVRPKSDGSSKPFEEAENFSEKEQSFGRGTRKKKPK